MNRYAKSGRGRCKKCDGFIAKDTVRFGSVFRIHGHPAITWKHLRCVTRVQAENIIEVKRLTMNDIGGLSELNRKDQKRVEKKFMDLLGRHTLPSHYSHPSTTTTTIVSTFNNDNKHIYPNLDDNKKTEQRSNKRSKIINNS
jgi:hypothetical protein